MYKIFDISNVQNYRYVSVISCISELFESLFKLSPTITKQHGFYIVRSTVTNILVYYIVNSLDDGERVNFIYSNFTTKFHRVNHLLLSKLNTLKVFGNQLNWLKSDLCGRLHFLRECLKNLDSLLISLFLKNISSDFKIYMVIENKDDALLPQEDFNRLYKFKVEKEI